MTTGITGGLRTYYTTGKPAERVEVQWEIRQGSSGLCCYLLNGPTGYESFVIGSVDLDQMARGWCACFGTDGQWDSLELTAEDMAPIVDACRKSLEPQE